MPLLTTIIITTKKLTWGREKMPKPKVVINIAPALKPSQNKDRIIMRVIGKTYSIRNELKKNGFKWSGDDWRKEKLIEKGWGLGKDMEARKNVLRELFAEEIEKISEIAEVLDIYIHA